jgi:hypothetical protein
MHVVCFVTNSLCVLGKSDRSSDSQPKVSMDSDPAQAGDKSVFTSIFTLIATLSSVE